MARKIWQDARGVMVALVALVLAVAVSGCGANPEGQIKSTISDMFSLIKSPTDEDVAKLFPDENGLISSYGISVADFMSHCMKHLDYTVDTVTVDDSGEKATAELTVKNVDMEACMTEALTEFDTWSAGEEAAEVYTNESEKGLFAKLFELLYAQVDAHTDELVETKVSVSLTKDEEAGWSVDAPDDNDAFTKALFGGMDPSGL